MPRPKATSSSPAKLPSLAAEFFGENPRVDRGPETPRSSAHHPALAGEECRGCVRMVVQPEAPQKHLLCGGGTRWIGGQAVIRDNHSTGPRNHFRLPPGEFERLTDIRSALLFL